MHTLRPLVTVLACLFLAVASPLVLADPGGGKGQGHSKQDAQDDRGQGNREGHGKGKKPAADDWSHGPSIDRGNVLGILGGHRDYWSPGPALPPGIQKNLARGKPLPPGIAKKLDSRLLGQLPRYEGYEWRQAGTDLILVAIASGVIYEVLNDVLN
ncbi:anti-virulence regulator CigR family protein [Pseudomonas protegens]|uniref:anti-virulence regulator CigR family protein n=1 Tax=Pseudomonas protegens TaxID=380021 RepID=UPI0038084707